MNSETLEVMLNEIEEAIEAAEDSGWHHTAPESVQAQHYYRLSTWYARLYAAYTATKSKEEA